MMKKVVLSILAATSLFAYDDVPTDRLGKVINSANNLVMNNHYVKVGVSDDGTFGTSSSYSANFSKYPGLEYDSTGKGNFTADILTPGVPIEGFSIKIEQNGYEYYKKNSNYNYTDIVDTNITAINYFADNNISSVYHHAFLKDLNGSNLLEIKHIYTLNEHSSVLKIAVYLKNVSNAPLSNVRYSRFLDPDPDAASGSWSTVNKLGMDVNTSSGHFTIPSNSIAYAMNKHQPEMPVGLFTLDNSFEHNVTFVSQGSSNLYDPDHTLLGGMGYGCSDRDCNMAIAFRIDKIYPGETKKFDLGYLFGNTLDNAVQQVVNSSKIDKDFVDSLPTGWHLVGTSKAIDDLSIFDNATLIWVYTDKKWFWYTADSNYKNLLEKNGIPSIKSGIKPLSGIWIYKEDISIALPVY